MVGDACTTGAGTDWRHKIDKEKVNDTIKYHTKGTADLWRKFFYETLVLEVFREFVRDVFIFSFTTSFKVLTICKDVWNNT